MIKRNFKGIWIPKEIWLHKDLTIMEKLFLVEIDSLDNENGCYASNAHFAEFFGISKGRCSQIIKSLEAKKLITIELQRDGKNITKRVLRILNTLFNKLNTPIKKTKYPYLENDEGNNTCINNTCERRAHEFLRKNFQFRFETLAMQHRSEINNWEELLEGFSDKVEIEELEWKQNILFARLNTYIRQWKINQRKYKPTNKETPEVSVYRKKVFTQ